jgi:phosphoserine phosphatase
MSLFAFDFDGTLSDSEMMVGLAERHGVAEKVEDITSRAMRGELSYAESLYERADLLAGLSSDLAAEAYAETELRPGAAELVQALNDAGHVTAILTGGFTPGVRAALDREGVDVDHLVANSLPEADGALTGDADGPLIEGTKDDALRDLAGEIGVDMADTVAVGDGANDLPMLQVAGYAIGFDPKPAVEPHTDVDVTSMAELWDLLAADDYL